MPALIIIHFNRYISFQLQFVRRKSQFVTFFFHPLLLYSLALLLPQSCQFALSVNTGNNNRLEQAEHISFIFWVTTRTFYCEHVHVQFFSNSISVVVKLVAPFLFCYNNISFVYQHVSKYVNVNWNKDTAIILELKSCELCSLWLWMFWNN